MASPTTQIQMPSSRSSEIAAHSAPRISGVDSIRFWLALWVYFSHFGLLPFSAWIGKSTGPERIAAGLFNNMFNGAAAVIGFFIISGFCIHYPFRRTGHLKLGEFYARRFVRIIVPLLAGVGLALIGGSSLTDFYRGILWSLIAELVYYSIYPLLRRFWRAFGWRTTLSISYGLAAILIASDLHKVDFHEFGPSFTWIIGLPCWLLGCTLADNLEEQLRLSLGKVWTWRLIVFTLSWAAGVLRFHPGVGYPVTLTLLGPVIFLWIRAELAHGASVKVKNIFERAGQFSYSIYLTHGITVAALAATGLSLANDSVIASVIRVLAVLICSYLFFLVIERPSHRFARWCSAHLPTGQGWPLRAARYLNAER